MEETLQVLARENFITLLPNSNKQQKVTNECSMKKVPGISENSQQFLLFPKETIVNSITKSDDDTTTKNKKSINRLNLRSLDLKKYSKKKSKLKPLRYASVELK